MIIKAKLISYDKKSFEKDGQKIDFSQVVVRYPSGDLVRYSANKDFDFTPFVDKEVDLDVYATATRDLQPKFKVVGVVKK